MIKINALGNWLIQIKRATIDRLQLSLLLQVSIVAILSFSVTVCLQWPESYWINISALLGVYFSMPLSLRRQYGLLIGVAFTIGVFAFISCLIAGSVISFAFFLFIFSVLTIYMGSTYPVLYRAAFVASLYTVLSAGLLTDLDGGLLRLICILIGFAIAIGVQIIFTRLRIRGNLSLAIRESLLQLAQLNQAIFSCYLTHNYEEERFELEKKLHISRSGFLYKINQVRVLLPKIQDSRQQKWRLVLDCIQQCYEIFQSLGLLLQRVDDHSTFAVADKEFLALSGNVDTCLRQMAIEIHTLKMGSESSAILSENIYELEEINRTVLQVVAKDPLVFMIFIQDMYALDKLLMRLSQAISISIRQDDKQGS